MCGVPQCIEPLRVGLPHALEKHVTPVVVSCCSACCTMDYDDGLTALCAVFEADTACLSDAISVRTVALSAA